MNAHDWRDESSELGSRLGGIVRVVLSIVGVCLLFLIGIIWVALQNQNHAAIEASEKTFVSLMEDRRLSLQRLAKDYAFWNDAIDRLLIDRDLEWAKTNLGEYLYKTFDVSLAIVINEQDAVLTWADSGVLRSPSQAPDLSPEVLALLASARKNEVRDDGPVPESAIGQIGGHLYLLSATRFAVESNANFDNPLPQAILLIGTEIEPGILTVLRDHYDFPELTLGPPQRAHGKASTPLVSHVGAPLALATWEPSLPGIAFLKQVLPWLAATVMVATILVVAFLVRSRRLAESLDRNALLRASDHQALAQYQNQLANITAHSPIVLFTLDRNGVVQHAEGWTRVMGSAPPLGRHLVEALNSRDPLEALERQSLEGVAASAEVRLNQRTIMISLSPYRNRQNAVEGVLGMLSDITYRRQAEAMLSETISKLTRSSTALERFVTVATSNLTAPVEAIESILDILADHPPSDALEADLQAQAQTLRTSSNALQMIVRDLLSYSQAGSSAEDLVPVNLQTVLDSAIEILRPKLSALLMAVDVPRPLPTVIGSTSLLVEVFRILLSNAIKFRRTEEASRLHISWTATEKMFEISVTDNGIGVPPDEAEAIFDIFHRIHSAEAFPGTGVGLAIARRIIDAHGGRIWLDRHHEHGACFRFTLPKA